MSDAEEAGPSAPTPGGGKGVKRKRGMADSAAIVEGLLAVFRGTLVSVLNEDQVTGPWGRGDSALRGEQDLGRSRPMGQRAGGRTGGRAAPGCASGLLHRQDAPLVVHPAPPHTTPRWTRL